MSRAGAGAGAGRPAKKPRDAGADGGDADALDEFGLRRDALTDGEGILCVSMDFVARARLAMRAAINIARALTPLDPPQVAPHHGAHWPVRAH